MIKLSFLVTVEVSHQSGHFVSKNEIAEMLCDEFANMSIIDLDIAGSVYTIGDVTVEDTTK